MQHTLTHQHTSESPSLQVLEERSKSTRLFECHVKELGKELKDADKRAQQASEREALLEEERRQGADSELRELFKLDGEKVRASLLASSGIARMGPRYPSRHHLFRQLTTRQIANPHLPPN